MPRCNSWPAQKQDRSMRCSTPGQSCCAGRSHSHLAPVAKRRRCCSGRQKASNPSTSGWRATYLEVLAAGLYGGRLVDTTVLLEAAAAARAAPAAPQPPSGVDLLLDGLALLVTEGYSASVPPLKRAVSAFCGEDIPAEEALRWLWAVCSTAVRLWDDRSWDLLLSRYVRLARDTGALGVLPVALYHRARLFVFQGASAAA